MCYERPGPRCSDHTFHELKKAKRAYDEKPSRETLTALRQAKNEYAKSPLGIQAVKRKAAKAKDPKLKRRYTEVALDLREDRGAALAKLKALHPEKFVGGKVSPYDRELANEWQRRQEANPVPSAHKRRQKEVEKKYTAAEATRLLGDPSTPSEVVTELAFHPDQEVRWSASQREDMSAEGLAVLSRDRASGIRHEVAWHKNTDAETVNSMVDDPNEYARGGVANSRHVTPANLSKLSRDKTPYVRGWAAGNPRLPEQDQERLSREPDGVDGSGVNVRASLAANQGATGPVLDHLAQDSNPRVRLNVASNPATSRGTLEELYNDHDEEVSFHAGYTLDNPHWNVSAGYRNAAA